MSEIYKVISGFYLGMFLLLLSLACMPQVVHAQCILVSDGSDGFVCAKPTAPAGGSEKGSKPKRPTKAPLVTPTPSPTVTPSLTPSAISLVAGHAGAAAENVPAAQDPGQNQTNTILAAVAEYSIVSIIVGTIVAVAKRL